MPNLIIIEGPDRSGKTTLANKLVKEIPNSLLLKGNFRPLNDSADETAKINNAFIASLDILEIGFFNDKTIIFDRYFPSEMVYSVLRGKDRMDSVFLKTFEQTISKYNHILIGFDLPFYILIDRMRIESSSYINENQLMQICSRYADYYEKTKLKLIKLTIQQIPFETILRIIKEREETWSQSNPFKKVS